MTEFKQYRRKAVAEIAAWEPGFDMTGVSKVLCSNFAKTLITVTPIRPEYVPRFTCKPQGTDI